MKRTLIFTLCLGALIGVSIYVNNANSSVEDITIKEVEVNNGIYGIRKFDLTYENIINESSSNVVIGVIEGKETLNNEREVFKVSINEQILGETNNKEILVYTSSNELLELGKRYLLFLSEYSSTLYDKDFYVQNSEFIIKVLDDGSLVRLIDVSEYTFEPPFINNKFNDINELVAYTRANFSKNNNVDTKVINSIESNEKLVSRAEHIIEIKVLNMTEAKNGLAIVDYEIIKKHKNGNLDNVHKLLLPKESINVGEEYLLFLNELDDGGVELTTRENSIVLKNDKIYRDIINVIK